MTLGVSVYICWAWEVGPFGTLVHLGHLTCSPPTDSGELWLLSRSHFLSIDVARGACLVPAWPTRQL